MRQRPPAILARAYGDLDGSRVVICQPYVSAAGRGLGRSNVGRRIADPDCRGASRSTFGNQLRQLAGTPAGYRGPAVNPHLRCCDAAAMVEPGIVPLTSRELRLREEVLPPELVPVGYGEGERDHVGAIRDQVEIGVRGRTAG